jgi:hypothetical protein
MNGCVLQPRQTTRRAQRKDALRGAQGKAIIRLVRVSRYISGYDRTVENVQRSVTATGFEVVTRRWVFERTLYLVQP